MLLSRWASAIPAFCLAATLAAQQAPPPAQPGQPGQAPPRRAGGRGVANQLITERCAGCHGANLDGGRAGSLMDDKWTYGGDDESILRSIRDGRANDGMPAFKEMLTDVEIRAILLTLKSRAFRAQGRPAERATPVVNGVVKTERHAFKMEVVTDQVETPWSIAFLPDGSMLVSERPGRLRIIENGKILPEPVSGTPAVWQRQDGGMFDIEVDPNYATNGWIYLSFAEARPENRSMTKIVRGKIRDGAWVEQQVLYEAPDELYTASNIHYGSRFIFDRQGYLLYSIGDRGQREQAQNLGSPFGKIHRITPDGKPAPGNPFLNRDGALPSVWSYGHRNPQGFSYNPADGKLWETEHGPTGGDEVNIAEMSKNYGWPVVTFGLMDGTGMPTETTAKEGMVQPIVHYEPSPGICPLLFYTGNRFPRWKNFLLVGTMAHEELRLFTLNGDTVAKQEVLLRGHGRVRDIVQGPDGNIYLALATPGPSVSATTQGSIVRLVPAD